MSAKIDTLLALKAHYLGRKVMSNPPSVTDALKMIDAAVKSLKKRSGNEEKRRLLFYYLLRCEITRDTNDSIELRQKARKIAEDICSELFDLFMEIENASQSTMKADGFSANIIAGGGIKKARPEGLVYIDEYGDDASRVLREDIGKLSSREYHFLNNTRGLSLTVRYP